MNVYDFAMKMEQDGKSFYEDLARGTDITGLRDIFTRLAADEQKHYEVIMALKGQAPAAMKDTAVLELAKNVFAGLLARKESLGPLKGDLDAYRRAMKLEADSFRLYEDAAGKEPDAGARDLLLRIAGEEHKHFNILENIHSFVNAPNQYLAWGEFSNLEEFRQFGRDND